MKPYVFILIFFGSIILIELISFLKIIRQNLPPLQRIKITYRINLVVFISGVLMLATALLFDVNYFRYEAPIPYSSWKKISFDDFRGLKRPNQTLDGQTDFAFIVCEVKVKRLNNEISVMTYFYPSRSYVFDNDIEDTKLLSHEIYHLHITEYSARLLRKQLMNQTKPISDNTLKTMQTKFLKFQDSLQFEYDDQTYHSYLVGKQISWEHKIDSCLTSLKNYENSIVIDK